MNQLTVWIAKGRLRDLRTHPRRTAAADVTPTVGGYAHWPVILENGEVITRVNP